jgi:hypothetical protein
MKDVLGLVKTVVLLLTVMWMFIGNEEVWDELLAEQDVISNATDANITVAATEMMSDSINTVVDSLADEF